MTDAAGDRPQDVGRKHRRRPPSTVETEAILERYRAEMRLELADLLDEIRPAVGQLTIDGAVGRPPLERRRALWDLGIKLGRELGAAPDPIAPADLEPELAARRRARPAPRLTVAARRALGGEP
jgi:hypothetical protein